MKKVNGQATNAYRYNCNVGNISVIHFTLSLHAGTPVARCLLNKQNGEPHGKVFSEIFSSVNHQYEYFNNGERIEAITVDFSDAEVNGLEEPVGKDMTSKILRGCKVNLISFIETQINFVFPSPVPHARDNV